MPQKSATYIGFTADDNGKEIRQLIQDAGIQLDIRDIEKNPLSVRELDDLFGHNPLTYFVNPASKEYTKLGLDGRQPERQEMLEMMAENPGLIRAPIIKTIRLLTAGCNKEKISEMLQISRNGNQAEDTNGNRERRITRRSLPSRK